MYRVAAMSTPGKSAPGRVLLVCIYCTAFLSTAISSLSLQYASFARYNTIVNAVGKSPSFAAYISYTVQYIGLVGALPIAFIITKFNIRLASLLALVVSITACLAEGLVIHVGTAANVPVSVTIYFLMALAACMTDMVARCALVRVLPERWLATGASLLVVGIGMGPMVFTAIAATDTSEDKDQKPTIPIGFYYADLLAFGLINVIGIVVYGCVELKEKEAERQPLPAAMAGTTDDYILAYGTLPGGNALLRRQLPLSHQAPSSDWQEVRVLRSGRLHLLFWVSLLTILTLSCNVYIYSYSADIDDTMLIYLMMTFAVELMLSAVAIGIASDRMSPQVPRMFYILVAVFACALSCIFTVAFQPNIYVWVFNMTTVAFTFSAVSVQLPAIVVERAGVKWFPVFCGALQMCVAVFVLVIQSLVYMVASPNVVGMEHARLCFERTCEVITATLPAAFMILATILAFSYLVIHRKRGK